MRTTLSITAAVIVFANAAHRIRLCAGLLIPHCSSTATLLVSVLPLLLVSPSPAHADIFQWEYINPADPSQGKRQSTTLAPDGAGVDAVPGAYLLNRDLTKAYLVGTHLTGAFADYANLTNAQLSQASLARASLRNAVLTDANLANTDFWGASLTDADLSGADVREAQFHTGFRFSTEGIYGLGTGITLNQLYSTASYTAHQLAGISLFGNYLTGGNFVGQNLMDANFAAATLTDADFTDADVRGARFNVFLFLKGSGITLSQLYSTASYKARDLTGIDLSGHDFAGADFSGQNLTSASFTGAALTGADFTGANVRGAILSKYGGTGITLAQLYSTASYQVHDLSGISLDGNELEGGNFAGLNFAGAYLFGANFTNTNFRNAILTNTFMNTATLTGADFAAADARGAQELDLTGAATANLIRHDGHIDGVNLDAGALLVVRDYDGNPLYEPDRPPIPITVDQHLTMGPGGTLRMAFEAGAWDSTISFAPGIPVTLGGTLELAFAPDVYPASQLGRTFDLFNWTGVTPTGAFAVASPYQWDLSNLYATGEVTLIAIPEPAATILAMVAVGLTLNQRRKIT